MLINGVFILSPYGKTITFPFIPLKSIIFFIYYIIFTIKKQGNKRKIPITKTKKKN